mgnify:CR=1 FL=1|tara:strand:+ start:316 stop:1011 length:696 start_codon:yes stop_codon:yes gene_type:complete
MNEFNLQKFVKKSKDEYYTKLYESKTDHSMDEEVEHEDVKEGINGDRIEGLLNIELKNNFLAAGHAVITDFLEDEMMDVGEIVSHLANELEKHYAAPTYGEETLEEASLNATEVETIVAALGGFLGLPAVAYLSQKAQDKLKDLKAKGKEALKEEEGDEEIEVEDEVSIEAPIEDEVSIEAPEDEAEDSKDIFAKLVDAYESAKKLGDDKLTRQLANTITYFNKSVIFGDS